MSHQLSISHISAALKNVASERLSCSHVSGICQKRLNVPAALSMLRLCRGRGRGRCKRILHMRSGWQYSWLVWPMCSVGLGVSENTSSGQLGEWLREWVVLRRVSSLPQGHWVISDSWLPYSTYLFLDFQLCSMTKLKEHTREICFCIFLTPMPWLQCCQQQVPKKVQCCIFPSQRNT